MRDSPRRVGHRSQRWLGGEVGQARGRMLKGTPTDFPAAKISDLETELQKLQSDRPVLEQAVKLQRKVCDDLAIRLSRRILEPLRAKHAAAVYDVGKAALEVVRANEREHALREELKDQGLVGVDAVFRPIGLLYTRVGLLRDPNSAISLFLGELEEFGFSLWRIREECIAALSRI
jgi:hypothetical protein